MAMNENENEKSMTTFDVNLNDHLTHDSMYIGNMEDQSQIKIQSQYMISPSNENLTNPNSIEPYRIPFSS
jgi:hypothetical protein